MRDVPWFGLRRSRQASNDIGHAENWARSHRAREMSPWLLSDPNVSRFVHPSGLALAGARITGSSISLTPRGQAADADPLLVPDGINCSRPSADITVRRSRTGPVFGNLANIHGDASFMSGDFGPVSFLRARIDGSSN